MADNYGIGAFNTFDFISNKTCYKACGYTDDDMSRPIIGIANSYNEMVSGHVNLRQLAEQVKYGIYRAGGTPVEFGVIACCDGVTDNHEMCIRDSSCPRRGSRPGSPQRP